MASPETFGSWRGAFHGVCPTCCVLPRPRPLRLVSQIPGETIKYCILPRQSKWENGSSSIWPRRRDSQQGVRRLNRYCDRQVPSARPPARRGMRPAILPVLCNAIARLVVGPETVVASSLVGEREKPQGPLRRPCSYPSLVVPTAMFFASSPSMAPTNYAAETHLAHEAALGTRLPDRHLLFRCAAAFALCVLLVSSGFFPLSSPPPSSWLRPSATSSSTAGGARTRPPAPGGGARSIIATAKFRSDGRYENARFGHGLGRRTCTCAAMSWSRKTPYASRRSAVEVKVREPARGQPSCRWGGGDQRAGALCSGTIPGKCLAKFGPSVGRRLVAQLTRTLRRRPHPHCKHSAARHTRHILILTVHLVCKYSAS